MSKVFKASNVTLDHSNKYYVEIKNYTPPVSIPKIGPEDFADDFDDKPSYESERNTIIKKAKSEAERIIKKAEVDAAMLYADMKAQSEKLKKETLEKSQKEGYEKGYQKGVAEAEVIKADALDIYNKAVNERQEMLDNVEPQMVELILKITSKLLNDTSNINPKVVINLIKQGIFESTITGDIDIRVSPDDFETVQKNKEEILSLVGGGTNIEILKDFSLNKLDCIIETPFGNIDCSLDQRYEALRNNIYYIFENR